uniref:Retrovirus-related Pol polyprotein from transposon TNT 1-94-like beta-barrel domain-containing protein n=1 Tax=Solanum lycopersicum TaxID=4081 RepID=A0A3Q7GEG2_SOLLC
MDPTALFTSRSGGNNFNGQNNRSGNVKINKQRSGYLYCDHCDMRGHNRAECNKLKYCTHCHKHGHLKDFCYQLIGYPTNYKGKRQANIMTTDYNSQFNNSGSSTDSNVVNQMQQFKGGGSQQMLQQHGINSGSGGSGTVLTQHFTPNQYQQVLQMMNKSLIHEGNTISTNSNANATGIFAGHSQFTPSTSSIDWIVDSGATDHMVRTKDLLTHGSTVKSSGHVQLPNGDSTKVTYSGCSQLQGDLGLGGSKPIATLVELNGKLTTVVFDKHVGVTSDPILSDIGEYQRLVGRLIYLTITRPDLSYAVQNLSQFMNAPKQYHMNAAIRVVRYIKQQPGLGVLLSAQHCGSLQAFCDADWGSCLDTRRSITGYMVTFGVSLLSWKSKKQSTISRSSAEAGYRSLASTVAEVTWILGLFRELDITTVLPIVIRLCCSEQWDL